MKTYPFGVIMKVEEQVTPIHKFALSDDEVLSLASRILLRRLKRQGTITSPTDAVDFLRTKLMSYEREVFAILYLDSANQIIKYKELFFGTINAASVYPREVVKDVLRCNAANVILAHNHPSGSCDISAADKGITQKLMQALALIDVNVLDHLILGESYTSFAERNLLN